MFNNIIFWVISCSPILENIVYCSLILALIKTNWQTNCLLWKPIRAKYFIKIVVFFAKLLQIFAMNIASTCDHFFYILTLLSHTWVAHLGQGY